LPQALGPHHQTSLVILSVARFASHLLVPLS
jgi:hypothetical protein